MRRDSRWGSDTSSWRYHHSRYWRASQQSISPSLIRHSPIHLVQTLYSFALVTVRNLFGENPFVCCQSLKVVFCCFFPCHYKLFPDKLIYGIQHYEIMQLFSLFYDILRLSFPLISPRTSCFILYPFSRRTNERSDMTVWMNEITQLLRFSETFPLNRPIIYPSQYWAAWMNNFTFSTLALCGGFWVI